VIVCDWFCDRFFLFGLWPVCDWFCDHVVINLKSKSWDYPHGYMWPQTKLFMTKISWFGDLPGPCHYPSIHNPSNALISLHVEAFPSHENLQAHIMGIEHSALPLQVRRCGTRPVATWQERNCIHYKLITFYDQRDSTVLRLCMLRLNRSQEAPYETMPWCAIETVPERWPGYLIAWKWKMCFVKT